MPAAEKISDPLPLRYTTPVEWADLVLSEPLKLLNDHAHLERKAAVNALELLCRWPDPTPPEHWCQKMTSVARDECEHLARVTQLVTRRGGRLSKNHRNAYAAALRQLIRKGHGPDELIDRLFVSALIEARSCERFSLLSQRCPEPELADFYGSLYRSEAGHYHLFVSLARCLGQTGEIDRRWSEMLEAEATIIAQQPPFPGIHSGLGQ